MIVGTAGHVDHGKTSLVLALTGIDTDRLKEEKARGITIDLGFAYQRDVRGNSLGFIDVPGHEKLVRTMVAGAAGIDFALLVIAGDDGPMQQTREHLDILDLLHLKRGLIVVTKCDRIDAARRDSAALEIRAAVAGTALADADILFVSATTGVGIDALRERIATEAAQQDSLDREMVPGVFRMSLDRAFSLSGIGTVATGTAVSGTIAVGDDVTLLPSGSRAKVRSLHAQNRDAREGHAGERCALALSGIAKDSVPRGAWLCGEAEPGQSSRIDTEVTLLASASHPLAQWTPVHFHCGASDVGARVTMLAEDSVPPGGRGPAQIVLDRVLPLRHGDRFVLRDQSARHTIGGGMVLDPRASIRKRRSPERLARLAILRDGDPKRALQGLLALNPGFENLDVFAADRSLTANQAETLRMDLDLTRLRAGSISFVHNDVRWAAVATAITDVLARFHTDHPDLPGLAGEKLRLGLIPVFPKPLFTAIRDRLAAETRIAIQGHWVRLPSHVVQLSAEDRRLEALMLPLIAAQRFRPPRVRDIGTALAVEEAAIRRACKALVRIGRLLEIANDQFFLRETVVEMAGIAEDLTRNTTHFSAADFRNRLDNGRKVAIQILEFFDRQGLTVRRGDLRRVVKGSALIFGASGDIETGRHP